MRHLLPIFLLAIIPSIGWATVNVTKDPIKVDYKTYDPKNRPKEMPELAEGESGVTYSEFKIRVNPYSELLGQKPSVGGVTATISVYKINFAAGLHITIWVPQETTAKLKAHEEGHRRIAEQVFQQRSVLAARAVCKALDGHRFSGEGANVQAAAQAAISVTLRAAGEDYLKQVAQVSSDVNNIYDEITKHGTDPIAEDEAIKQAFDKYYADHPDLKPTTKPATRPVKKPS